MIPVRRLSALTAPARDRVLTRGRAGDPDVARSVTAIIGEVRQQGDDALRAQARRLDGVDLHALEVPMAQCAAALADLPAEQRTALDGAAAAIRRFHVAQRPRPLVLEPGPGLVLGRRPDPLDRVGVYAPGGRAAYPSSVLMGVIPARVAGVRDVVVCSPAGRSGHPSPLVMAACAAAQADRLFALGGAGAIAAMALGTGTVPRVDRIVGPGNAYVTEAKRQLSAIVGMDSPAGPSELLVIADGGADPDTIARELLAQAEHDPDAAVVLVATDAAVARATAAHLARLAPQEPRASVITAALAAAGAILVADDLEQALVFASHYAPEHLLLLVDDPRDAFDRVRCAGTVFLGPRSSVAFGDYATGANHVLPTGGLARSYSGLAVDDFVRWTTWQEVGAAAAPGLAAIAAPLAEAEGLPAHAAAARRAAAGAGGPEDAGASAPAGAGTHETPRGLRVLPRVPYRSIELYDPARRPVALDLSANTNLWGSCPPALEALGSAGSPTGYPTPYADRLKEALAQAWSMTPSGVVTGCGSDDVIDSALRAFCEPGAVVAFPAPTFPMAHVFARMNDAEPRPVPLTLDGSLDRRGLDELAEADVVYLCRPNNPTGAAIPRSQVVELLDRARGLVLLDEAYGEYAGESLVEPALASGRALVLRTFSKAYGLAGLRVGYALGPDPLVRIVEASRGPYKVGAQAEAAAVAAVQRGRGWVADVVRETARARAAVALELRGQGLRVFDSRANFLLVAPPGPTAAGMDGLDDGSSAGQGGWAVGIRAALLEHGIGVRAFPALEGVGDAIRITLGPMPLMERVLGALGEIMRRNRVVA
jgi:histidinol dehydrogenase